MYLDYDDTATLAGVPIDNDAQDRYELDGTIDFGYEFSPGYSAFIRQTVGVRRYERNISQGKDSVGYATDIGLRVEVTRLVAAEIFGGYMMRDYDAFKDETGFGFGLNLIYDVERGTRIQVNSSRSFEETIFSNSSGYTSSNFAVIFERELSYALVGTASAYYTKNDYADINQEEEVYGGHLGLKKYLTRNLALGVGYDFDMRDSSAANRDFERNRIGIDATFRY